LLECARRLGCVVKSRFFNDSEKSDLTANMKSSFRAEMEVIKSCQIVPALDGRSKKLSEKRSAERADADWLEALR
jgi:hypothetical protein